MEVEGSAAGAFPEADASQPATVVHGAVTGDAEIPTNPSVLAAIEGPGDDSSKKEAEETGKRTTQDPLPSAAADVPGAKTPRPFDEQMSDESGAESEPEFWKNANPTNWKSVVDVEVSFAKRLNTSNLYKAYTERLQEQDEAAKGTKKGKRDTAPGLVRGVVNYVRTLEERIKSLEKAEEERKAREGNGEAGATGKKAGDKDEFGDLIMDVRFFHADGEFDNKGEWKDNIRKKGSYQCNLDPKFFIRVLYNWAEGVTSKRLPDDEKPKPSDVDIVAFGVQSKPISSFFSHSLDFETDKSGLVRFGKPFVPLIRNLRPLRVQLEKLESKFGAGVKPNTGSDLPGEGTSSQRPEDSLPFALASTDEPEEAQSFDTIEALAHFRYLLKFVDEYLANPIELYQRLRAGLEDKIAFENMWMLFNSGDEIYCPSHPGGSVMMRFSEDAHESKPRYVPQLFQVLGTTGGVPKRTTLGSRQSGNSEDILAGSALSDFFFNLNHVSELQGSSGSRKSGVPSKWRSKNRFTSLDVVCFHVDFDGVKYGTVREVFVFKPHDGLIDIRSLMVFPIQYLRPEPDRVLSDSGDKEPQIEPFLRRGKKFIDVTALAHLSYEGLTVGKSREEINSAVIIDFNLSFQEYQKSFPDSKYVVPRLAPLTGFWPTSPIGEVDAFVTSTCDDAWCHKDTCIADRYYELGLKQLGKIEDRIKGLLDEYDPSMILRKQGLQDFKQFMEEHQLIRLLPGVVPGFVLRNRKWVQLDLDLVKELQQGDDWEKLVLPPGHREMVQAMVETHTRGSHDSQMNNRSSQKKAEMDLVQGKGKGCIILLHGVPGVGKTSTAECVAAYTQRPLYPITCGDIGYAPGEVEKNMEEHFKLAHKWGCVLLLDEADVFLAKRNKADVKRNGLVSVFLRILEYYSGILFLTTNRVGAIDDAFRSRLHLTLYYPKLTEEQTRKIWRNNLSRLKAINRGREENNQEPISFDKTNILDWVKLNWQILQWNGRQIRNAFQTAIALAEFHATNKEASFLTSVSQKKSKKGKATGPSLDVGHFTLIAKATLQFNEYLLATHGGDEDELAKRDKMRLPSYETTLQLKELTQAGSSSSDDSDSDGVSAESSSDESAKEAVRKKTKKKDKKKSKAKRRSKKVQSGKNSSDSETQAEDKKSKTKKKAKKVQSEGSSGDSETEHTTKKE